MLADRDAPATRPGAVDVHAPEVDHVVQLIDRARRGQVALHALITERRSHRSWLGDSTPEAIRWRPAVSAATATASTSAA